MAPETADQVAAPPSPDLTRLVADAYREAALQGADMRRAVESLESVRQRERETADPYAVSDALDAQIVTADDEDLRRILDGVRVVYRRGIDEQVVHEVAESFAVSPRDGWVSWRKAFARALSEWRFPPCSALAHAAFPLPADGPTSAEFKSFVERAIDARWGENLDVLLRIARDEVVPPAHRLRLLVGAAQIQLYYLFAPDETRSLLDEASKLDPEDFALISGIGEHKVQLGEVAEARECFQRSVALAPDKSDGYNLMGDTFERENDFDSAEEWYREAIGNMPGGPDGYTRLIRLFGRSELFPSKESELAGLFDQTITAEPTSEYSTYLEMGSVYQQNKRYDTAHEWYDRAVAMDPTRMPAYTSKAYAYMDADDLARARELFRTATDVAADGFDGHWGLALVAESLGDFDQAIESLTSALALRPSWEATIRGRRGELYRKMGRPAEAEEELLAGLRLDAENAATVASLEALVDSFYEPGSSVNEEDCRRILGELRSIIGASYDVSYFNLLGNLEYYNGDFATAAQNYSRATELQPGNGVLFSNLALAWASNANVGQRLLGRTEAITALQRAQELNPNPEYEGRLAALRRQRDALERFGELVLTPLTVDPIVVEVGGDLVRRIDPAAEGGTFFSEDIPAMRNRIQETLGVSVPGIRWRPNELLASGGYAFSLSETPSEDGAVEVDWHAILGDLSGLTNAEVPDEGVRPGVDPITHQPCSWIAADYVGVLEHRHIETTADTAFVLRHLQHLLLRVAWRFFGIDEAESFMSQHGIDDGLDQISRVGLARVLRALLRDGVSLRDPSAVLDELAGADLSTSNLSSAIGRARLAVRDRLPGNQADVARVRLPDEVEELLGSTTPVGLPSVDEHALVQRVREMLPPDQAVAIVTRNEGLRPYLQRLFDSAIDVSVGVLSTSELIEQAELPAGGSP